jgi:glycosyltransferase involved in cell wall biosynthesis
MRILYILNSLGMGGAERQTLAVAKRMASRGHAIAVMTLMPRLPEEWTTGLRVHRLDMRASIAGLIPGLLLARRFCKDFEPDLLHSHSFHANIFARLLGKLYPRAAVLSTVHNVYEGGWARMAAYRMTDPLAQCTTVVSEAAAERFLRIGAIARRRCIVVANGVDPAEFAPDDKRRARMRAEMGIDGEFVWLAAGRVTPAKDFPNLLQAFVRVHDACPQARLWIAGEPMGDPSRPATRSAALIAELKGRRDDVRWLGLRRDMPALLDAADAFVLSSAWEGMPLAVGEAMAMEKSVAATDVGGVRELVGDTGALVPPRDADALARAMLATMEQPMETRRELGRAARQRIEEHFSLDARADAWESLYRSLAEGRA